jgi:hypothetical protein
MDFAWALLLQRRCNGAECSEMIKSQPSEITGGPERTRTSDLRFRKPLLYPTELRDRKENFSVGFLRCSFPFSEHWFV